MRFIALLIAASVALPVWAQETPNMKAGQWELTIKNDMPGMPAGPQSFTTSHCYTPEDVKDAQKLLPKNPMEKNDCTFDQMKVTAGSMVYAMSCQTKAGKIVTKGTYTYKGDSFEGVSNTEMPHPQGSGVMKLSTTVAAKRIGECKK